MSQKSPDMPAQFPIRVIQKASHAYIVWAQPSKGDPIMYNALDADEANLIVSSLRRGEKPLTDKRWERMPIAPKPVKRDAHADANRARIASPPVSEVVYWANQKTALEKWNYGTLPIPATLDINIDPHKINPVEILPAKPYRQSAPIATDLVQINV